MGEAGLGEGVVGVKVAGLFVFAAFVSAVAEGEFLAEAAGAEEDGLEVAVLVAGELGGFELDG